MGAKKGRIPWNKNITKEIDFRLKKAGEKGSRTIKDSFNSGKRIIWNKGKNKFIDGRIKKYGENGSKTKKGKPQSKEKSIAHSVLMKSKFASGELIQWNKGLTKEVNDSLKISSYKNRISTLSRYKNGTMSNSIDTKPELIFESYLKELNINYRKQEIFAFYAIDFYLYDIDIYVEIDGDYWHANPKFYSVDELNKNQLNHAKCDKSKNTFMKNRNKILLRFWEDDVINNKEYIIDELKLIIKV